MPAFSSILCGVDFSDHSAQALRAGAALAEREGATLQVVAVIDPLLADAAAAAYDLETLTADTEAELRAFVASALPATAPNERPALHVVVGHAAREILRAAESFRADLIVVGTQGLGGFRKLLFGSITDQVLRDTGTAVLVVPPPERAGATPLEPHGPIVAAVDVDRPSGALVATAGALARDLDAPLVLVHVVQPLQTAPRWRSHAESHARGRQERARQALAAIATEAKTVRPAETLVVAGNAADEIPRVAAERRASLIAIGLGRPRGVGHRPGSTAYRVGCCAGVPVLALPEAETPSA